MTTSNGKASVTAETLTIIDVAKMTSHAGTTFEAETPNLTTAQVRKTTTKVNTAIEAEVPPAPERIPRLC